MFIHLYFVNIEFVAVSTLEDHSFLLVTDVTVTQG